MVAAAFVVAGFVALSATMPRVAGETETLRQELFPWIVAGNLDTSVALLLDPLSTVMVLVVSGVGLLIHLYSVGYMGHDPGYPRFFTYLNLFTFSMLLLVMADNFLVMFVGWELVGVCSFLLIGYWFDRPAAASAGKKAFITNRVGDFAFMVGLFLIFTTFGSFDFATVLDHPERVLDEGGRACHGNHTAPLHRRYREIGPSTAIRVAARRDGRPHAGECADPRSHHGHGGGLHGGAGLGRCMPWRRSA